MAPLSGVTSSNRLRRLPIRKASFRPMSLQAWKPASLIPLHHTALLRGELIHEVSQRGKILLGWNPVQRGLMEELPDIVEGEAKALGLIQGHAVKVTQ